MSMLLRYRPDDAAYAWLEEHIQEYIVMQLRKAGVCFAASLEGNKRTGAAIMKAKRQGLEAGEPDLRIYRAGGKCMFIELKRKGGVVSKVQIARHVRLERLGFTVHVVWAATPMDGWLQVERLINGS